MAIRVFELAKELGVTSKDMLDKCRSEGIELKNHMAALSAGLEATIRQWFTEGSAVTAVESGTHVNLETARKKRATQRRRRGGAADAAAPAPGEPAAAELAVEAQPAVADEAAVAVAEAPPAVVEAPPAAEAAAVAPPPVAAPAQAAPPTIVQAPESPVVAETPAEPVAVEPAPAPEAPAAPAPQKKPKHETRSVPNEPARPKVIGPAGPQVVPSPARLQGPRVVRFDGVEPSVPLPRRAPRGDGRSTGSPGVAPPPGPGTRRPKTAGVPTPGEEEGAKKGAKRRSPRRKSGRTAETGEGLREWRDRDLLERSARLAAATGGTLRRHRASVAGGKAEGKVEGGAVEIDAPITIKSFSAATGIKSDQIIRKLLAQGTMLTINQPLPIETAEALALEYGLELKIKRAKSAEELLEEQFSQRVPAHLEPRAPIVTFLGHVDHGKTSLLDRIRNARVAAGEEGGITQGIGSYRYDIGGKHVVFLDTPGHEAFTAMRARGANMTDVVVLVVAADDGVMPQTIEALNHAKAAGVPIVVALNKIDLPNANQQKALGQLAEHGLNPREWGGATEVIRTSATTGAGIDDLVEVLSLEAELLELKADVAAPASGWVVEAQRDPNKGVLATVLVKDGTLKVGDVVLAGKAAGRVRIITTDLGKQVDQAGPATPVAIAGLDDVPDAGDKFFVVEELSTAKEIAEQRRFTQRAQSLAAQPSTSLENLFEKIEAGEASEVRLVVKADVQGSLEALLASLKTLGLTEEQEVKLTVLHSGVGGITEGDVLLAEASSAIIMGFRVVADQRTRVLAELRKVEIRTYRVIYQLLEEVEAAIKGKLAVETAEQVTGRAEVREVFKISRVGSVAGCIVTDGVIPRNSKVRITRDNVVLTDERTLASLRRFKDDVREVRAGLECGIRLDGFDDIKTGDVIEAYQMVEVARK